MVSLFPVQINANAMVQALSPESQPLVELGRGLGAMVGSIARPPCEVTLSVSGGESPVMCSSVSQQRPLPVSLSLLFVVYR